MKTGTALPDQAWRVEIEQEISAMQQQLAVSAEGAMNLIKGQLKQFQQMCETFSSLLQPIVVTFQRDGFPKVSPVEEDGVTLDMDEAFQVELRLRHVPPSAMAECVSTMGGERRVLGYVNLGATEPELKNLVKEIVRAYGDRLNDQITSAILGGRVKKGHRLLARIGGSVEKSASAIAPAGEGS